MVCLSSYLFRSYVTSADVSVVGVVLSCYAKYNGTRPPTVTWEDCWPMAINYSINFTHSNYIRSTLTSNRGVIARQLSSCVCRFRIASAVPISFSRHAPPNESNADAQTTGSPVGESTKEEPDLSNLTLSCKPQLYGEL